ncbi:ATP-binding protein [Halodesulfovibrio sp.]|uniref:AAA family ATPase n=1 Tax=Halodesulfovibrio sp. TaxID=1912772 RepID=UPI0025C088E1|nr:ATP-binding protein [Halodesulfovibrio sp.]
MTQEHVLLKNIAALAARRPDNELLMVLRRSLSKIRKENPDLANELSYAISSAGGVGAVRHFNSVGDIPRDQDSGLELIDREDVGGKAPLPIFSEDISQKIYRFIKERKAAEELRKAGIKVPSSLALVGKPGTGKTSLARAIASELNVPFMVVNLAAIVTSYLGQTGQNIKKVLDRAKIEPCVLLLDEFDALGYQRGDDGDVGEMRRVVTVLLQEIENWPEQSVVIAATNMPEQVDLAFQRRFSTWLEIPLPNYKARLDILTHYYPNRKRTEKIMNLAASALVGASGADIEEFVRRVRIGEVVEGYSPKKAILYELEKELFDKGISKKDLKQFAQFARDFDSRYFTYRKLGQLLGISHTSIQRLLS